VEFNTQQKHTLLSRMGYNGPQDESSMEAFIQASPGVAAKMGKLSRAVQKGFATGGWVISQTIPVGGDNQDYIFKNSSTGETQAKTFANKTQADAYLASLNPSVTDSPTTTGGAVAPTEPTEPKEPTPGAQVTQQLIQDPSKLTVAPQVAQIQEAPGTTINQGTGQMGEFAPASVAQTPTAQTAQAPSVTPASLIQAASVAPQVARIAASTQAVQGQVSEQAQVTAAQQTKSSLEGMEAAQGQAILMNNPVQREVQAGELISGSTVDAAKVDQMMASIQAAEATPSKQATVQGQLEGLMQQFEGGQTPAWAAGAMRAAQATLAQRGLGASSLAGQAVIQAAMESALPIAQIDANTRAQFESQNLSNRQQTALFAAQQRAQFLGQEFDQGFQTRVLNAAKVADIANMNFTAEQNIALENSRIANTVNLTNLNNRQAMTLAQAAALANLDVTNLNNRQQAAVQNAQSFLQMDMQNLSNAQQTEMFRAQANIQALFTDQAAENAARQFNAASQNQTNQFFADLSARVSQFNAEQTNAINQFNAGQTNAGEMFNKQLEAQRSQFNAANSLVIAQANAQWRQNLNTTNTAAQNEANMELARTQNAMSAKAMDELWQRERDTLNFAFVGFQQEEDRALQLVMADRQADLVRWQERQGEKAALGSIFAKAIFGGIFK
jgi:hypothetical protein